MLTLLNAEQDTNSHLPPSAADLLLHPHMGLFPFPSYFKSLHEFLAKFYFEDLQAQNNDTREGLDPSTCARLSCCLREGQDCSTVQVNVAARILPSLLPKLDDEGVQLLLFHLKPLFVCTKTRLYALIQLFDLLAQALGPKATVKTFIKPLMGIFDSHFLEDYEHIVSQSFLSQIIVRFGLEKFLKHFMNSVVDAVAFKSLIEKPDILVADRTADQGVADPLDQQRADKEEEQDTCSQELSSYSNEEDDNVISISGDGFQTDDFDKQEEGLAYPMSVEATVSDKADQVPFDEMSRRVSLMPSRETEEDDEDHLFQEEPTRDKDQEKKTPACHHDDQKGENEVTIKGLEAELDVNPEENEKGERTDTRKENLHVNWKGELKVAGNQQAKGDSETTNAENQTAERDGKTANTEDQTADKDSKMANTEDQTAEIDGKTAKTEDQTAEKDGKTANTEDQTAEKDGKTTNTEDQTAEKDGKTAKTEDQTAEKDGKTANTEDQTAEKDGKTTNTEDQTAEKDGKTPNPENQTAEKDGKTANTTETRGQTTVTGEKMKMEAKRDDTEEDGGEDKSEEFSTSSEEEQEELQEQEASFVNYGSEHAKRSESLTDGHLSPGFGMSPFFQDPNADVPQSDTGPVRAKDELSPGLISGIAADSLVWLAPRLGPVLTSKFIASQLLSLLTHCYIGEVAFDEDDQKLNDKNAKWVLYCLGNFCALYGDAFILDQFLPHAQRTVK